MHRLNQQADNERLRRQKVAAAGEESSSECGNPTNIVGESEKSINIYGSRINKTEGVLQHSLHQFIHLQEKSKLILVRDSMLSGFLSFSLRSW